MFDLAEYIRNRQQTTGRPVYMPYLTVGDPNFDATVEFALAMVDAGADILELGIPFSDPTADGPVIQAAMVRALAHPDFSLDRIFEVTAKIHAARPDVPLVFLSYVNPVVRGFAREGIDESASLAMFLDKCRETGVRGLVLPDLPFDQPESTMLREMARARGVSQVLMAAPNTSPARFKAICKNASGFLYYVTSYGVTGERKSLPEDTQANIDRLRAKSGVPILAGFGISRPEQVVPLRSAVDGVIVGSLHHRIIEEQGAGATDRLREATSGFVDALRPASTAPESNAPIPAT